jgi:biopolymer transport protein ExbD
MNFRDPRGKRRLEPGLDMTPLIDMVFLLLLFFVITSNFVQNRESQLPIQLPSAAAGEALNPGERTIIFVTQDGGLQIDEEVVRPEEVEQRLRDLHKTDPNLQILVKGDQETAYGRITAVIDVARQVGFQKVNLIVKRKGP